MDKVYGAYLCTGCGIGEVLDVDGLKSVAGETGIAMQSHPCLCGAEGRALIEQDIKEKNVNTVVICGCSPRVMQKCFCWVERIVRVKFHLLYDRVLVVAFRLPSVESSYLCLVRFCKLGSARGVVGAQ